MGEVHDSFIVVFGKDKQLLFQQRMQWNEEGGLYLWKTSFFYVLNCMKNTRKILKFFFVLSESEGLVFYI